MKINITKKIKKGNLVILNECDQPGPRMIVLVTSVQEGVVYGKYISKDIKFKKPRSQLTYVTRVSDFGVRMSVIDGSLLVHVTGNSTARYSDGKPRQWQRVSGAKTKIKPKLLNKVIESIYGSDI